MRLGRLDLNLLVALDALLQECSVSLAADRLNLSQSATSGALARLRDYFKDDLLVLRGRSMVLTPRAEELIGPLHAVLHQIRTTLAVAEPFDAAASDRTLAIMATDYIGEVLLCPAIVAFAAEAPLMRFELVPIVENPVDALQRGRCDILIGIDSALSTEHPSTFLFAEEFVIVGWQGNRWLTGAMTPELYAKLGHVTVRFGRQTLSYEENVVRARGIERRVEVIAPHFTAVAGLLVGTNRIATMHRLLAERMARFLPLKIVDVPFELPPLREVAQWASRNTDDPVIAWGVRRLQEIAGQLATHAGQVSAA